MNEDVLARVQGDEIIVARALHARGALKALGASWDPTRSVWTLAATRANALALYQASVGIPRLSVDLSAPLEQPRLHPELFEYQVSAVDALTRAKHGQMLVMSPGLGKTATAIVAADNVVPPNEKVVVVTTASLQRMWKREVERWALITGDVYVVDGRPRYDDVAQARWIITTWDRVAGDPAIWGRGWPLWVLDESVLVKGRRTRRFKALSKVRAGIDRLWLLTGSPTTRYADDLWTQLNLIWPKAFRSYWRFAERYCYVEETPWGKKIAGNRQDHNPMTENDDLVTVVQQEDVLNLPEYLFEPTVEVLLQGHQAREYARMEHDFIAELKDGTEIVSPNELTRLQHLQRMASCFDGESAKADALTEIIERYEPPYLVWTYWRETAEAARSALATAGCSAAVVTGATSSRDRDVIIENFKEERWDALVISMGVGKFGLTMTNVNTIIYLDKSWDADAYFQSLHRVRRIGLDHSPVVVTIKAVATVDELVEANLEGKMRGISQMTKAELATLLGGLGRT